MRYITREAIIPLDILLLTYNCLDNTKRCIDALYKNTSNFGLTIIDNASTDGSVGYLVELAHNHNNITLDLQEENLGVVKGRNYAYAVSRKITPSTDYIMFLDNDQFVHPSWKEVYMSMMVEGYDIVGSEAWTMKRNKPYRRCMKPTEEFNYVGCGGMMIKHHVIESIGLFDEQFAPMYFEDPDFCFRAFEVGYRIAWRPFFISHNPHKLLKYEDGVDRALYFHKNAAYFAKKYSSSFVPHLMMPPVSIDLTHSNSAV